MKNGSYRIYPDEFKRLRAVHVPEDGRTAKVPPIHVFTREAELGRQLAGTEARRDLALALIAHVGNFEPESLQRGLVCRSIYGVASLFADEAYKLSRPLGLRLGVELDRAVTVWKAANVVSWIREARGILLAERDHRGFDHRLQ